MIGESRHAPREITGTGSTSTDGVRSTRGSWGGSSSRIRPAPAGRIPTMGGSTTPARLGATGRRDGRVRLDFDGKPGPGCSSGRRRPPRRCSPRMAGPSPLRCSRSGRPGAWRSHLRSRGHAVSRSTASSPTRSTPWATDARRGFLRSESGPKSASGSDARGPPRRPRSGASRRCRRATGCCIPPLGPAGWGASGRRSGSRSRTGPRG